VLLTVIRVQLVEDARHYQFALLLRLGHTHLPLESRSPRRRLTLEVSWLNVVKLPWSLPGWVGGGSTGKRILISGDAVVEEVGHVGIANLQVSHAIYSLRCSLVLHHIGLMRRLEAARRVA